MSRKRRLEIELPSVSEVIEIAKDPPVSLRLRPKKAKSRRASETPHEQSQGKNKVILSGLMDIEQRTATLEKDEIEEEVRNILGMMHSPMAIQNGFVRSKAAAVLARTLCIPHCPSTIVDQGVEELLMQLKRDESWDVKSQVVLALSKITPHLSERGLIDELALVAKSIVGERHYDVRASALHLICSVAMREGATQETQIVLSQFARDCDSRVRQAALSSLLQLHSEGVQLDLQVYKNACECLKDDNEEVRLTALRIVQVIGVSFPEKPVPLQGDISTDIRLVDDAFVKVCDMVNDLSMQVRAQSSRLLGLFKGVGFQFLEQTLDKKLMSHLRKKKTEHEKRKERHAAGQSAAGWDSGRQWGAGWSKRDFNPDEVSLMNQGSCGAFVHGLEDEYLEVRMASLEALCLLAMEFPLFAVLSLDFLVDMFNDEIDTVRLKAIDGLRHVVGSVELREDQLETILGVLLDSSPDIREAIRMLLGSCCVNSKPALNLTISSLLSNLTRYPQDRPHIWICLKELGQHHGSLAFALLPELLNTHPFFSGKEPDIEDPAYIGVLILVFNAACCYPTIIPLFPQHTVRHYPYLRGSLPDLVPHLELKSNFETLASSPSTSSVDSALHLITRAVEKVGMVSTCGDLTMVQTLLESTTSELKRLSELSHCVQAVADCSSLYLKCQLLLLKAFRPWLWRTESSFQSSSLSSVSLLADNSGLQELLELSYAMQYGYTTLTATEQAAVMEIRVLAHVYQLLSHSHVLVYSKPESRQQISCLFDRLQLYEKLCQDSDIRVSKPVEPLLFAKESVYSGKGSGSLLQTLQQALEHVAKGFVVQTHHFSPSIRRASAEILIPQRDSEKVIEFVSSLATSVQVEAVIENVSDTSAVCIQVVFPDGKRQTCHPKPSDFKELSENKHRLRTSVVLSHDTWSDYCKVQVSVALMYSPDLDESVLFNINEQLEGRTERTWSSKFAFFKLGHPVDVRIMPKERFY